MVRWTSIAASTTMVAISFSVTSVALFLSGLPPLATVSFRVSVTTKKVTGAHCQPVSLIVH
jgi:hypothetical protein